MPDKDLIGFVYTTRVAEAHDLVRSLVRLLQIEDRSWIAPADMLEIKAAELDRTLTIVTAGGDGTILRAVGVAAPFDVSILGINLGRVGFMTELNVEEAPGRIREYFEGNPRVEERMMIQASIMGAEGDAGEPVHALNDIVVTRGGPARILDIEATVDGIPLTTYRADGVIVATATGSTGYALSAGGPILYPEVKVLLLQPLAPHMSLHTGLVLDADSVIELTASGETDVHLSLDGHSDNELAPGQRVTVRRSPHVAKFLRASSAPAFYANLFDRLGVKEYPDRPPSK